MSLLRISRPGHPTILVDQGVAHATSHGWRGTLAAPSSIVAPKKRGRPVNAAVPEQELRGTPKPNIVRCGAIMPLTREPCFRTKGHRNDHRSEYVMRDQADRRRGAFIPDLRMR